MQIPGSVGVDNDGDGVNDGFVGAVTNAAASTISGLEIEGNVLLGEALSLQYSAGFLDASFDEYLVGGVDVSNDRDVQNTPEEMVFGGVNYHLPAFSGDLLLSANYAYNAGHQSDAEGRSHSRSWTRADAGRTRCR